MAGEQDLTSALEYVASALYRQSQAKAEGLASEWEDVPANAKMAFKQGLLPTVMATLEWAEEREINTSAEFGHAFMAKVEYADGGTTWHGPFESEKQAWTWLDARLVLDYEDLAEGYEGEVVTLNLVEPRRSSVFDRPPGNVYEVPADAWPTKVMREYAYPNASNEYESQEDQSNLDTCSVWALHLNVWEECKDAVLERMSELPETTGEYGYGDSFVEWGEESKGDDDKHMAIYFRAAPEDAWRVGSHIADHAHIVAWRTSNGIDLAFHISTSGDFAEQLQEPQ